MVYSKVHKGKDCLFLDFSLPSNCSIAKTMLESESVSHSLMSNGVITTPWAVAHEAPLSMEFSRQEY